MAIGDVEKNNNLDQRYEFGGGVLTNVLDLVTLVSENYSSTTWSTPRKVGETTGYTPPSGKKFVSLAVRVVTRGDSGNNYGIQTSSADVGFNSATSPAGLDYTTTAFVNGFVSASTNTEENFGFVTVLSASRYFAVSWDATAAYSTIFGYEVPA